MSLHLIFSSKGLDAALPRARSGDVLVLLGDAVYATPTRSDVHAVAEDAAIRGVTPTVTTIDYDQLAELCAAHNPVVSWND